MTTFTEDENQKFSNRKEIDEIYDEIGFGRYQIKVMIFFSLHFMFGSLFLLTPSYFFQLPIFQCNGVECTQEQYCESKQQSINDLESVKSITYYFQLYCDKNYLNTIGLTLPFGGGMLGLFFFMWIGDNYGRRVCIGFSWLTGSLGGLLMVAFNSQLYTIYIGIFITGFGLVPANFVELVMLNEISTGHKRSMSICFMYVAFGIAELFIWPLTYVTTDWRQYNFYFLVIPYLILNIAFFFIYESPKFLQQRDLDRTAEVLMKIANQNGQDDYIVTSLDIEIVDKGSQTNYSYIDLFKYKSVRTVSLCMLVLSMGIHILYYGMQMSLDMIGKDFAENSFYVGLADFFGYLISDIVCPKFKRKTYLNITLFISALFCFSFALDPVPDECLPYDETCIEKTLQIAQAVAARFIISFSFSFMIIWMQELYPTSVRSIGVGLCSALGIGGAQLAPLIKDFSISIHVDLVIILGIFGVLGCCMSFFLPETFEKPLLEEIPELTRRYSTHQQDYKNISEFRETQTKKGRASFIAKQKLLEYQNS